MLLRNYRIAGIFRKFIFAETNFVDCMKKASLAAASWL